MPGSVHLALGSAYAEPAGPVPEAELLFISLLLTLTLLAVGIEIIRKVSGRSELSSRQFWLRMGGGGVMLLLVGFITFGALFMRPEDGRIFAWFWAFCSTILLVVIVILRVDVAWTRREVRDVRLKMRDERLKEVREIIERHGAAAPTPAGGNHAAGSRAVGSGQDEASSKFEREPPAAEDAPVDSGDSGPE